MYLNVLNVSIAHILLVSSSLLIGLIKSVNLRGNCTNGGLLTGSLVQKVQVFSLKSKTPL